MDDLLFCLCHVIGVIVTSSGTYDCSIVLQAQKLAVDPAMTPLCIKISTPCSNVVILQCLNVAGQDHYRHTPRRGL